MTRGKAPPTTDPQRPHSNGARAMPAERAPSLCRVSAHAISAVRRSLVKKRLGDVDLLNFLPTASSRFPSPTGGNAIDFFRYFGSRTSA